MKFRKDFVTNSSSSSYVCEVCGRSEEGRDLCLSEAGMYECENGHTFCEDEIVESPNYKEFLQQAIIDDEELLSELDSMSEDELEDFAIDYEFRYYIPEKYCPICNFLAYSDYDMSAYLLKTKGIAREEVFKEIKKVNKRRKKLYDSEYILHVCSKFNLTEKDLIDEVKNQFSTYKKFEEYLNGKI